MKRIIWVVVGLSIALIISLILMIRYSDKIDNFGLLIDIPYTDKNYLEHFVNNAALLYKEDQLSCIIIRCNCGQDISDEKCEITEIRDSLIACGVPDEMIIIDYNGTSMDDLKVMVNVEHITTLELETRDTSNKTISYIANNTAKERLKHALLRMAERFF